MLIALMADVHANRQAFSACLDHARERGAQRYVLLGDYVGYGADPAWTVAKVMELVEGGATAVLGNHDAAIASPSDRMHEDARDGHRLDAWPAWRGGAPVLAISRLAIPALASSMCTGTPARRKSGPTC